MDICECVKRIKKELDSVVSFWTAHSHDKVNGGYYNCLTEDGKVYDSLKYGWLQGRQVWMYSKLYNTLSHYHTPEILGAAKTGGEFLLKHVLSSGGSRCYFILTEEGKPCKLQRKPYTECFFVIGLAELSRATGEERYWLAAESMLASLIHWIRFDDSELGAPNLPGCDPCSELGRPMMLLNVLTEICNGQSELRDKYKEHFQWAVEAILKHSDGNWVREHVAPNGSLLSGCRGRQVTPGHALEAGWFLLQEAATRGDTALQSKAIKQFIEAPYAYGQDKEFGGLYYFLDTDGYCPTQLEWSMKLWWVHCEAMIAFLMAYEATGDKQFWTTFSKITDYTLSKFSDQTHGEWYGYLTRTGEINQTFKGGPYKGCFHVPRCLLYCLQILERLDKNTD